MGLSTSISWTDLTWNIAVGCNKVDTDCKFCVDPTTLVLTKELIWKPIKDILVGDELIAFDEHSTIKGKPRRTRLARVEGKLTTFKEALRITTSSSSLICSYDHPLLKSKPRTLWIEAGNLCLKDKLPVIHVNEYIELNKDYLKGYLTGFTQGDGTFRWEKEWGSVWKKESPQCYWRIAIAQNQGQALNRLQLAVEQLTGTLLEIKQFYKGSDKHQLINKLESRSQPVLEKLKTIFESEQTKEFKRGWLAGIFDAEGSHSATGRGKNLRIANINPIIQEKIVGYGKEFGFDFKTETHPASKGKTTRLYGDLDERIRFFTQINPAIQYKKDSVIDVTPHPNHEDILKIEALSKRELIDIQTSTRTFFANGFFAHNCYMYRDSMNATRYIPNVVRKTKTVFNLPLKYKNTKSEVWDGHPLVFTSSLTDVFHPDIDSFREEAFAIIKRCPHLTFQLLTKRPERIRQQLPDDWGENGYENVWLGTSIGHQGAIHRLEELSALKTKESSFLTFLSLEPLHSEIDFLSTLKEAFSTLDWVIIGGESGNENGKYGYRECKIEWIESILDQCDKHRIPVFVKQLGTYLARKLGLKDRHGISIEQWPEHLRRRQFPANRYAMA